MAQLRRTRDPQKRIFCCASCTHDLLTAVASVSDIVFDVLVAVQFYRDHHLVFCTLSIIIFAIAQAAYAFLFTSAYASHLSIAKRLLVFVAVLPIAQITPVFSWIESLHWPALQRLMLRMDLRPSDDVRRCASPPRFAAHRTLACPPPDSAHASRRWNPETGTPSGSTLGPSSPLTLGSSPKRSWRRCRSASCRPPTSCGWARCAGGFACPGAGHWRGRALRSASAAVATTGARAVLCSVDSGI